MTRKVLPPSFEDPLVWLDEAERLRQRMFSAKSKDEAISDGVTFATRLWHLTERLHQYHAEHDLPLARSYGRWQDFRDAVIDGFPAYLSAGRIATEGKHYEAHDPLFDGCVLDASTASAVGQMAGCSGLEVYKLKNTDGTQPYAGDAWKPVLQFIRDEITGEAHEDRGIDRSADRPADG